MESAGSDFCFPCTKCGSKFDSLRFMRKHKCDAQDKKLNMLTTSKCDDLDTLEYYQAQIKKDPDAQDKVEDKDLQDKVIGSQLIK